MRVLRVVAIVAQDEQIALGNCPMPAIKRLSPDVGFDQCRSIHYDVPASDRDRITRCAYDALDKVQVRLIHRAKDDNVAADGRSQLIRQTVDQDEFAILQRGRHAQTINPDASRHGIDDHEEYDRKADRFQEVKQETLPLGLFCSSGQRLCL